MASGPEQVPSSNELQMYARLGQEAAASVDHLLSMVPIQRLAEIDMAERAVVRLRDCLIDDLRASKLEGVRRVPGVSADIMRAALRQVNVALSLIVGVEYPATGSQRQMLEMARDALKSVHW